MADHEVEVLKGKAPANYFGYLGGFHPLEIAMVGLNDEGLAEDEVTESNADAVIDGPPFLFDS